MQFYGFLFFFFCQWIFSPVCLSFNYGYQSRFSHTIHFLDSTSSIEKRSCVCVCLDFFLSPSHFHFRRQWEGRKVEIIFPAASMCIETNFFFQKLIFDRTEMICTEQQAICFCVELNLLMLFCFFASLWFRERNFCMLISETFSRCFFCFFFSLSLIYSHHSEVYHHYCFVRFCGEYSVCVE